MDLIASLAPEGLPLWAAWATIIAAFFTAALTAAFGLGGGLALLAVMSAVLPAPAIIPIHGVAQLGANSGRFFLLRKEVLWQIAGWFALGCLIGTLLGGRVAVEMPIWALRASVGVFILYTVWGPRPAGFLPGIKTYFLTGAAGGFLTMFFGATGPIAATMLSAAKLNRLNMTATHAACMVAQHGLKIAVFGLLGFAYAKWALLILAILGSSFAGTAIGTHFLRRMPEKTFKSGFNIILTLIACYLLVAAGLEFRTN